LQPASPEAGCSIPPLYQIWQDVSHDYEGQLDFLIVIGIPSRGLASKTNSW
jgi:hypothetical protein